MHPDYIASVTSAGIDVCVLANNHVLDFGYRGLSETISTIEAAGMAAVGVGVDDEAAGRPAIVDRGRSGRVVVAAAATSSSGVPEAWAAGPAGRGSASSRTCRSELPRSSLRASRPFGGRATSP
jgi:poly-gamma-glutamate capsule biosynthesis protein CapA/YwtB (metallophosphatase superfamily)